MASHRNRNQYDRDDDDDDSYSPSDSSSDYSSEEQQQQLDRRYKKGWCDAGHEYEVSNNPEPEDDEDDDEEENDDNNGSEDDSTAIPSNYIVVKFDSVDPTSVLDNPDHAFDKQFAETPVDDTVATSLLQNVANYHRMAMSNWALMLLEIESRCKAKKITYGDIYGLMDQIAGSVPSVLHLEASGTSPDFARYVQEKAGLHTELSDRLKNLSDLVNVRRDMFAVQQNASQNNKFLMMNQMMNQLMNGASSSSPVCGGNNSCVMMMPEDDQSASSLMRSVVNHALKTPDQQQQHNMDVPLETEKFFRCASGTEAVLREAEEKNEAATTAHLPFSSSSSSSSHSKSKDKHKKAKKQKKSHAEPGRENDDDDANGPGN